ncbi:hypothetical protein RHMOL_Rhmol11G0216500 [Rhododendron molle]|uniref:Uncharacterized protein n=1 Tax=Rhododendron molle TaxID=49168 RepID=A0ACC0LUS4_RHOML|nr:hypothetical protein RHMOL_Rhmol11G0216500 [Rhododendron molle]
MKVPECQMRMVEWVWDLYGMGRLLEAVDAKLGMNFDEQELERLMIVGLWCAHPDPNLRPNIRQAIHVLNFHAPLPILPSRQPAAIVFYSSIEHNPHQFWLVILPPWWGVSISSVRFFPHLYLFHNNLHLFLFRATLLLAASSVVSPPSTAEFSPSSMA